MFWATGLHETLHGAGITHLVFAGVTTEVCVQTSMREANDRGYECLLIEDATESYFPAVQGGDDRDDRGAGRHRRLGDAARRAGGRAGAGGRPCLSRGRWAGRNPGKDVVRHQVWRRLETEGVAVGPAWSMIPNFVGADMAAFLARLRDRLIARKAG